MFILLPYRVDVPYDRRPVANWVIFAALIFVFALQVPESQKIRKQMPGEVRRHIAEGHSTEQATELARESVLEDTIYRFALNGWTIRGVFGYTGVLFIWLGICFSCGFLEMQCARRSAMLRICRCIWHLA